MCEVDVHNLFRLMLQEESVTAYKSTTISLCIAVAAVTDFVHACICTLLANIWFHLQSLDVHVTAVYPMRTAYSILNRIAANMGASFTQPEGFFWTHALILVTEHWRLELAQQCKYSECTNCCTWYHKECEKVDLGKSFKGISWSCSVCKSALSTMHWKQ